jgi:LuxR family transcriptional regulator, maltose regulon positive regulatory protein
LQEIVRRPALVDAVERGADGRVTVISAPPGSGKSYLLRAWKDTTQRRVGFVAVQRHERDEQRFWLSVFDALQLGDSTSPTPGFDGEAAVARLVGDLRQDREPLVLVIDDLHELESPAALAQLQTLLDQAPDHVSFVLSSRRDPPLRLHQLRLEGELTEIRAADISFDATETEELLRDSKVALSEHDLSLLHDRTEGWAAGLRLAAIALADHPQPGAFVAAFSGSDRTVAEYLLAEMLDRQPDPVRRLLLRTSIADRISGPLADLLVGGTGSHEILQGLEDANAFVVSLDPGRTWFRYHHLFGDLLRLELGRTTPDEITSLHVLASEWFAEHGHPAEAIRHAQAAADWERAARLLSDHALGLSLDGEAPALHAFLQAFPEDRHRSDPALALVRAEDEQQRGSLDEATAYLSLAEAEAGAVDPARRPRFEVLLAAGKLSLARRRGDFSDVTAQVESLARLSAAQPQGDLRAVALMNLGIAEMWSLQLDSARAPRGGSRPRHPCHDHPRSPRHRSLIQLGLLERRRREPIDFGYGGRIRWGEPLVLMTRRRTRGCAPWSL